MKCPIDISQVNLVDLKSKIKKARKNLKLIIQNASELRNKYTTERASAHNIEIRSTTSTR